MGPATCTRNSSTREAEAEKPYEFEASLQYGEVPSYTWELTTAAAMGYSEECLAHPKALNITYPR